jgi:LysR family transcriptional regulator, glycine cleavage system transcriptional activator
MARRLPSLNALKAFEAAARHESFTLAAEELFVTHAAISRHIRELEEALGTDLFIRTGRGVKLTESGSRFGSILTPLFDRMAQAVREAAAQGMVRTLQVSAEPAIASRWIVPRLGRFNELHPDIELAIDPTSRLVDFRAGEADLGIRYGLGRWDDVEIAKLSDCVSFPVCAPRLISERAQLKPADLRDFNLLHEQRKQWWADWLALAGVSDVEDWRGTVFQNHLAIEAAEAGQGFALGDQILVTDAILEGRLARPFDLDMKDHGAYFIVRARGSKETAPARAFREWLLGEMAETHRKFSGLKAAAKSRAARPPAPVTALSPLT